MGMGPPHRLHLAVQIPCHGPLFAGCLSVKIHQDHVAALQLPQNGIGHLEGAVQVGIQLHPAHEIDHSHGQPPAFIYAEAPARDPPGIVGRAEYVGVFVQEVPDLDAVPGVVAQGDHVRPGVKHPPGLCGRNAHAGSIFPVYHRKVDVQPVLHFPQAAAQNALPALAYNIAHGQYPQFHNGSS